MKPLKALSAALLACLSASSQAQPSCSARSTALAPTVIELYTSQGCSSCPPAERWLAALPADDSVLALAFHVQYWDYLGWRDRFASPQSTQRQREQLAVNGSRILYTPQVVVDGQDRRDWPQWRPAARKPAPLQIELRRTGPSVQASLQAGAASPARLAGWWLRSQRGLETAVAAGENAGQQLRHQHVVLQHQALPAFDTRHAPPLSFRPEGPGDVTLLLTDATSGKPVQALRLACAN